MEKFKNKYRIESIRLQTWDYGNNGSYFITICTKNREHFFGEIHNGKMQLNELGKLAEQIWMEIPTHFKFIELGNFVIMPDHFHGVLMIDKNVNDQLNVDDRLNEYNQINIPPVDDDQLNADDRLNIIGYTQRRDLLRLCV